MTLLSSLARSVRPLVERSPRAAMTYRHFRDLRDISRAPVQTPLGFKLVGNAAMERGEFEEAETAFVQRATDDADVVINIGANIGYYCCVALQRDKRVVAFEPIPGNLRYLYRNIRANGWADRIEISPIALGASPGLADIYGGGTAASLVPGWADIPLTSCQTVPVSTLDLSLGSRFLGDRLLILVDIEGAELEMLQGAAAVVARKPQPVWMVEISIDEHQPGRSLNPKLAKTFDIFEQAGYAAWQIGSTLERLPYSRIRRIAASGVNSLTTHNFVFAAPLHVFA